MRLASEMVLRRDLKSPDGRPLYGYMLSKSSFAEIERDLQRLAKHPVSIENAAPEFVIWAAEHIRARFPGGPLTWAFVFDRLGLPSDDQALGRRLTERGLLWWSRGIRESYAGHRLFLYSLMAEGGIPEALLKEPGLYRDVVLGLLGEIEAEGGLDLEPSAVQIASRWALRLPQTFQGLDFARLLAGLALALAELRSLLPEDLPDAATVQWLTNHRPNWTSVIPLRMTTEVAESLIQPALAAGRGFHIAINRPICTRELRRHESGWRSYLTLNNEGWLPARHLPGAADLWLRLFPAQGNFDEPIHYSAAPEDEGWRVRRSGRSPKSAFEFPIERPFVLVAYADDRLKGEATVEAGLPAPHELHSFWRMAEAGEGAETDRLVPHGGKGRSRSPCLWILTSEDVVLHGDAGVTVESRECAPDGTLWRFSGSGQLLVGGTRYRIETGAEGEAQDARLLAFGKTLSGWRADGYIPVFLGEPMIYGQSGAALSKPIPASELRRTPVQGIGTEVVEWIRGSDSIAQVRLIRLPKSASLKLKEEAAGQVALTADGLGPSWRLSLSAGKYLAFGETKLGAARLTLETPGQAPGVVQLRLSEPDTGRFLVLHASWPARVGMLLDSEGVRLDRNRPISVNALQGWRAIVPQSTTGDIQLHLVGSRPVSLLLAEDIQLANYLPLIQAMLAQGGPDAQLNLSLVVTGEESPRLEIRRYQDLAMINGEVLQMGLARDAPALSKELMPASGLNEECRSIVHATSLKDAGRIGPIESSTSVNLLDHFDSSRGPWLIHSHIGARVQRTVVWNPLMPNYSSREVRINSLGEQWRMLVANSDNPDWNMMWRLISIVGERSDAGALDQVQALVEAPVAAICRAFQVQLEEMPEIFSWESSIPIFWPIVRVSEFTEAVKTEHLRLTRLLRQYFDESEAEAHADNAVVQRIVYILSLRPELASHFCRALVDCELFDRIVSCLEIRDLLMPFLVPAPEDCLVNVAQEAAKRFHRLPQGVRGLAPLERPTKVPSFNRHLQAMIDAPLVVAEMAVGLRSSPNVTERLMLINLRMVDTIYFDTALPHAIELATRKLGN